MPSRGEESTPSYQPNTSEPQQWARSCARGEAHVGQIPCQVRTHGMPSVELEEDPLCAWH